MQIEERSIHSRSHTDTGLQNTEPGLAVTMLAVDGRIEVTNSTSRFVVAVLGQRTCGGPDSTFLVLDSSRSIDRSHQWPEMDARISPW